MSCKKPIMNTDTTSFDEKRTVKVSGVSQLLRDQIEKEFQRKGNSTGYNDDVNKLLVCPNGDYVLVEFEKDIPDPKDIGDTLNIGGTALSVERCKLPIASTEDESVTKICPPDNNDDQISLHNDNTGANSMDRKGDRDKTGKKSHGRDARQNQINQRRPGLNSDQKPMPDATFGETKVKLDKDFAKKIGEEAKLQEILNKEHVELHKDKLKGTWNAIFAAGKMLLAYIPGFAERNYDQGSNFSSQSSIDQSADAPLTTSDQSAQSKESDESFSVSSLFLRFIIAYHYEEYQKLENVSQEISYEVTESKTDRNLKFFVRKNVNRDKFSKTVDEFIYFYQNQNQKMHQEVIPMLPKEKNDLILDARAKFSVVIDSAQDPDKITIYGEKDNVQRALKFLRNQVGDLTTSTPSSSSKFKGATESSSSKGATGGISSPNAKSTTGGKVFIEKLSCVLFQDMKVFVYQGNITKETVDVIVNPANEHLHHSAGAAEAIVKAGGKSIQDESDAIMRKRCYVLNPGEVVATKAGNLRCNLIIHVVGPRWANYYQKDTAKKVLLSAVLNCLTSASHYGATSISIPAISSGIFGVPVPICAEILFMAAINFANNAPKSNYLKEIRFVNIDKPTSQVFAQEMKKRFGASIHRENVELFHSNNVGENEKANQNGQSQFNDWKQNPTTKPTKPVDPKPAKATFAGSRNSGNDNKGSQGGKSNLNPKASAFTTSRSDTSSTPTSYSNAVTRNTGKDKTPGADPKGSTPGDEECSVCLSKITDKKTLDKCGHSFCAGCIDEAFKHQKKCPICSQVYGQLIGNQPPGTMIVSRMSISLRGYESCGSITITYKIEDGVQGPEHPNPGKRYFGTVRSAHLPDNEEGNKILRLLQKAFDQKLTFTIGRSSTTGATNVVTWNDIHHKTKRTGGPTSFGYPDPGYLKRVQEELAAKGITE